MRFFFKSMQITGLERRLFNDGHLLSLHGFRWFVYAEDDMAIENADLQGILMVIGWDAELVLPFGGVGGVTGDSLLSVCIFAYEDFR